MRIKCEESRNDVRGRSTDSNARPELYAQRSWMQIARPFKGSSLIRSVFPF